MSQWSGWLPLKQSLLILSPEQQGSFRAHGDLGFALEKLLQRTHMESVLGRSKSPCQQGEGLRVEGPTDL